MIKSTIVLRGGTTVTVECASAGELGAVINSLDITGPRATESKNDVRIVASNNSTVSRLRHFNAWSEHDILLVAKLVTAAGPNDRSRAAMARLMTAVRREATDQKHRNKGLYVMIQRIRQYLFAGDIRRSGIAQKTLSVLKQNGYFPAKTSAGVIAVNAIKKRGHYVPYSKNDLVTIGKIIRLNLDKQNGLSALVHGYLKVHGENRERTEDAISWLTCAV
jgi:hypothetical protein